MMMMMTKHQYYWPYCGRFLRRIVPQPATQLLVSKATMATKVPQRSSLHYPTSTCWMGKRRAAAFCTVNENSFVAKTCGGVDNSSSATTTTTTETQMPLLLQPPPLHHEPHKNKIVRRVAFPSLEERRRYLAEADFNVFHLTPDLQITFDMFSAGGTAAMTQEQRSHELVGDEAYAGSRSFERLEEASRQVFGHPHCCPAHNGLGAMKLLLVSLLPNEKENKKKDEGESFIIPSNVATPCHDLPTTKNVATISVKRKHDNDTKVPHPGDIDLDALETILKDSDTSVAFLQVEAYAEGLYPFSIANLQSVRNLADRYGKTLVLDASRIVENAWYILHHGSDESESSSLLPPRQSIHEVIRAISKCAHVIKFDAAQDAKCPTGALLATDDPNLYERFRNEVVVYEGLHTYGGMSGRTMESFATGLEEMTIMEDEIQWTMHQSQRFCNRLQSAGVPLLCGCDGAYIRADAFLPHLHEHKQDALSAALYEVSGVRACALGRVDSNEEDSPSLCLVPVQIPRLAMTNRQLDQVADAIICLYNDREKVPPLELIGNSFCVNKWRDQMKYRSIYSDDLHPYEFNTFPFIAQTIERTGNLSREERKRAIEDAGYNTFLLKSADVSIDLLTDSGTSAMSTEQWAAYNGARSTPATSDEYNTFVSTLQDITGYEHILPVHQGRAAEQILSEVMIQRPGQLVPGNMYFTTTKLHQELAGGVFADVIVDEAHDPQSDFPWKGNIDLRKLEKLVEQHGPENIAYISFEHSVNMAGGQPVSMENMRDVHSYCSPLHIPVFFDSTRMAENAFMIQRRDPHYATTKESDILREMMMYGDGCTVSGKKDFLINIGGVLAFRDNEEWKVASEEKLRVYEGSVTDGGLSSADLAATTVGLREMVDDRYIRSRVLQTAELGRMLTEGGVPIVTPPGSHAIFVDAKRFLPHIDQDKFPAQCLASEIYVETGVRAMERGTVSKGRDPDTGENCHPSLELVRLTIPRRVYTMDHLREVATGIIGLYERRNEIGGLNMVYEPEKLRFFQGRFEKA